MLKGTCRPVAAATVLVTLGLHCGDKIRPNEPTGIPVTTDQGHLRDDTTHPPINGADNEHMAAAVAGPPDPYAGRVDRREGAGVGDRMPVVPYLLPGIDLLAGFAVTGTKITVVEDECP